MANNKKKILTVNCIYKEGSTGNLISIIASSLDKKYCFVQMVEYSRSVENSPKVKVLSKGLVLRIHTYLARKTGLYFFWPVFTTNKAIRMIKKEKPDIIHIHCPNSGNLQVYRIIALAGKKNIPLVITNHCEVFYTAACFHARNCTQYSTGCKRCPQKKGQIDLTKLEWKLLQKAYSQVDTLVLVAVSNWQMERIKKSGLFQNPMIRLVLNGIDDKVFAQKDEPSQKDMGKPKILHVTSYFSDEVCDTKGGAYLIELAKRHPEMDFFVIGRVKRDIKIGGLKNVHLVGYVDSKEVLSSYYNNADLTIVTSKQETYGLVCAESLCCGTPVIGFKCGGTESIADERYSAFCNYADSEALNRLVSEWVYFKRNNKRFGEEVKSRYSLNRMVAGYERIYDEILERN